MTQLSREMNDYQESTRPRVPPPFTKDVTLRRWFLKRAMLQSKPSAGRATSATRAPVMERSPWKWQFVFLSRQRVLLLNTSMSHRISYSALSGRVRERIAVFLGYFDMQFAVRRCNVEIRRSETVNLFHEKLKPGELQLYNISFYV